MTQAIKETHFQFPGQVSKYSGKVRDVYNINEDFLVIVASDRISAFDHVLPRAIPYKGQVLNQTSAHFFQAVEGMVPTHVLAVPDPNVTIGIKCDAYPVEVVVRAYLAGHAWRVYKSGKREICGVTLPEGLRESDPLPEPIITPATKSKIGHDEDISEAEILKSGLIDREEWAEIRHYALQLFAKGTDMARERGLILVDTKYEFGQYGDKIYVIDEIHTPDSSRYYYLEGYEERQQAGQPQKQLSKEFVREWLMANGFQGLEGQQMPDMPDSFVQQVSERYIELYEQVTGKSFVRTPTEHIHQRIMDHVVPALEELKKIL
ncbi:MAG: phosphoribosylaminoimidazolesuccinocarboxamide synthase [Bacteroidetes bacterium]|nr:MAG: phosphoribosylaminoimidazolesuccinocarboxamide synthase [Bacteroidota bacterium]